LSEQAKIASLQERIKQERSKSRTLTIGTLISFLIAATGIVLFEVFWGGLMSFSLVVLGVVLMILCSTTQSRANRTRNELLKELDSLSSKVPTCPKCGKEIPKDNYIICPFCGSRLTPPP
jgi:hypothetical protein